MNEQDGNTYLRYRHLFDKKWKSKTTGVSTPAVKLIASIRALKGCSFEEACKTLDKGIRDGVYVSGGYNLLEL